MNDFVPIIQVVGHDILVFKVLDINLYLIGKLAAAEFAHGGFLAPKRLRLIFRIGGQFIKVIIIDVYHFGILLLRHDFGFEARFAVFVRKGLRISQTAVQRTVSCPLLCPQNTPDFQCLGVLILQASGEALTRKSGIQPTALSSVQLGIKAINFVIFVIGVSMTHQSFEIDHHGRIVVPRLEKSEKFVSSNESELS